MTRACPACAKGSGHKDVKYSSNGEYLKKVAACFFNVAAFLSPQFLTEH